MFTYSRAGIHLASIQDTRREKAKGTYPIKYRITFLRKQRYYTSGIDLMEQEWKNVTDPKKTREATKSARSKIQTGFLGIRKHIDYLIDRDTFTFENLNLRLKKGITTNFKTAIKSKIKTLELNDQLGSAESYTSTLKKVSEYQSKELSFADITPTWLKSFEKFLLKDGKAYTTIGIYLRNIRHIMNQGKELGIISDAQYPFKDYKIPKGEGRKLALSLDQINKVMTYPLTTDKETECRDLWYFSFLCNGANISDILRLKFSNIENGEVCFYRQKTKDSSRTKKMIVAVLLPEMQSIIDKWGSSSKRSDNYVFPYFYKGITPVEEKKNIKNVTRIINRKIKAIGIGLGFGNISTYTARHSFATILYFSGSPIGFISESIGHSDQKTTTAYLDSFKKEERLKYSKMLTFNNQSRT
ncbi:MAG: site-specific integrase [Bacteroidetes bacterium]|jgi:integrase/recombinase XerD|nr:site-specific integrase [Bacteroidota bacterium]MBT7463582.1 site-specific integrase [Bacteroidota bacterium]